MIYRIKEGVDDTYKFDAFGFDIAEYPDGCTVHLDNEEETVSDVLAAASNHVLPEFRLRTDAWNPNNVRFPDRPFSLVPFEFQQHFRSVKVTREQIIRKTVDDVHNNKDMTSSSLHELDADPIEPVYAVDHRAIRLISRPPLRNT
uniref:DBR1 domain-containing protein n=1 Tax=Panagrellus redivivus TaxID=6233 RepID=A0A7E4UU61_PANRE